MTTRVLTFACVILGAIYLTHASDLPAGNEFEDTEDTGPPVSSTLPPEYQDVDAAETNSLHNHIHRHLPIRTDNFRFNDVDENVRYRRDANFDDDDDDDDTNDDVSDAIDDDDNAGPRFHISKKYYGTYQGNTRPVYGGLGSSRYRPVNNYQPSPMLNDDPKTRNRYQEQDQYQQPAYNSYDSKASLGQNYWKSQSQPQDDSSGALTRPKINSPSNLRLYQNPPPSRQDSVADVQSDMASPSRPQSLTRPSTNSQSNLRLYANPYNVAHNSAAEKTSTPKPERTTMRQNNYNNNGRNRNRNHNQSKSSKNKNLKTYANLYDQTQADAASSGNSVIEEEYDSKAGYNKPIKNQDCTNLQCRAGGKCVPDTMRGGVRCQCPLGTEGEMCERDVVVKYPKFMGFGYMAFPVLRGAYREFTINIEFRPDTHNGLLLFSSEQPDAKTDFFSVALMDGHVEFRFDCGTGMAVITTENMVELGQWNSLSLTRRDWEGSVTLNEGPQVSGRSRGLFSRITFRQDLYLGGYRNLSLVGSRTGIDWGYVGCVRKLSVNSKQYDMRKGPYIGDAIHGMDVGECSSRVCDEVRCMHGGRCVADSADTSVCLCPVGVAGDRCESKIDIYVPSFDGTSYMQFIGLRRTVLMFTEIEIVFKPIDKDGLILYNGYRTDRTGDYISLAMVDGVLEFRFDLGTGAAVIKSAKPLTIDHWHTVKVTRTGRDGKMKIDNQPEVTGMAKGSYTQLTLTLDLFIGGHRNFDEITKSANAHQAFKGCIQKVIINEKPLKLLEEIIDGVNIENCDHKCVDQPCQNGGRCIPIRDMYKCSCPLGFESTNCEQNANRPVTVPMFSGDSFLMYDDPLIMQKIRGVKNDIQLRVKAAGPNGLLLWAGEEDMGESSDYIAVGMDNGHALLRYNLGSGEVVIPYNESRIDDGRWHKIRIQRYQRVGSIEVDGGDKVEDTSPGGLQQLNVANKVFLGGMHVDKLAHNTLKKFTTGFEGCINELTIGPKYQVKLMEDVEDGENIHECTLNRNKG